MMSKIAAALAPPHKSANSQPDSVLLRLRNLLFDVYSFSSARRRLRSILPVPLGEPVLSSSSYVRAVFPLLPAGFLLLIFIAPQNSFVSLFFRLLVLPPALPVRSRRLNNAAGIGSSSSLSPFGDELRRLLWFCCFPVRVML